MCAGDVETFSDGGQWKMRIEGTDLVLAVDPTRDEAVERGRRMATTLHVAHTIRGADGQGEERTPYSATIPSLAS